MRPINLKIKGLNSFMEAQEINFEKLTHKGLFGIFGPTGSGKSTILDGITLALFGDVARKSTNFMNTNCDTMNVCYEFQMTEKEVKRYRVEREFKRDKKAGSIRTKSAKVVDITDDEIVLEEKERLVTKKCEEIIGLKLDDFTRTVVLPQGKFSEFLKLEGRERRDMLERLFNLQKYGDNLSNRLKNKLAEEYQKSNVLDGELKGYENINDDIFKEKTAALNETKKQIEKYRTELRAAENAYNEGKEVWGLQIELKDAESRQRALLATEEDIREKQMKAIRGESSLKAMPYIDRYLDTLKQIETVNSKLSELKARAEIIKEEKNKAEIRLQDAIGKKDTLLPNLKIKEQKVLDAIEEKKSLDALLNEKNSLEINIKKIETSLAGTMGKINDNNINITRINESINAKESKSEILKVPENLKNKVNDGFVLMNSLEGLIKHKTKLCKDIEYTKNNSDEAARQMDVLAKELNEKENLLKSSENSLKVLIDNCPGDQNTLLGINKKFTYVKDKWDKHDEYCTFLESNRKAVELIKKDIQIKEKEKLLLAGTIADSKEQIKKIETENIAHTLREALAEGEACPVCGSREHHKENIKRPDIYNNIEVLREALSCKEEKFQNLTAEIIKFQTNLNSADDNIKQYEEKLKELGDDYKVFSSDVLKNELYKKQIEINNYNSNKNNLEKRVRALSEERNNLLLKYSKLNGTLDYNREQLEKLKEDIQSKIGEMKGLENELNLLKDELNIDDFKRTREEINKKEREKNIVEKEIRLLRDELRLKEHQREKLSRESTDLQIELEKNSATLCEKVKSIEEKQTSIKNKAGDAESLESIKEDIIKAISEIEKESEAAEMHKRDIERQFNECSGDIISLQGNLLSLKESSGKDEDSLERVLAEEGIKDIEEARENLITKSEIENLNIQIENYKNSLAQLDGALAGVKNKLNGRNLTDEQWNNIQELKNKKADMLNILQEAGINLETEVNTIAAKLESKRVLLEKKEELEYELSILNDLRKLFEGKRFVEFVAANQLKYMTIEAGRKLKEITGGTYGLEVNEDGKFLIRDYKNGGAQRDASTLSGGETFVASLALALALSSQIQLKGTAPLELFFLDEGFGTLDDNLLDVVMDSLEKIHNNKLTIGIISHVESIKNRVPVKLIVSPAEAGLGGSKVKIERGW